VKNLKLRTKLFLLTSTAVMGSFIFGVVSYATLEKVKVGGPIYNDLRLDFDLHSAITPPSLNIMPFRLLARQLLLDTDHEKVQSEGCRKV